MDTMLSFVAENFLKDAGIFLPSRQ